MVGTERFSGILSILPENIGAAVKILLNSGVPLEEIRVRKDKPISVTVSGKPYFLLCDGSLSPTQKNSIFCDESTLKSLFLGACDNSVFAHTGEMKEGYISFKGGIRIGVCGEFLSGVLPKVSSLNIRIAREIKGCGKEFSAMFCGGMLICGPPGCGKTTVLRDLIRLLSESGKRITVIDSRREISGGTESTAFDLGPNTDIIYICDRAKGAEMALRTMFPSIIAIDEIGTAEEAKSVLSAFNSGVDILVTAHTGSVTDLKTRPVTKNLLLCGAIKTVAVMPASRSQRTIFYDVKDILSNDFN